MAVALLGLRVTTFYCIFVARMQGENLILKVLHLQFLFNYWVSAVLT